MMSLSNKRTAVKNMDPKLKERIRKAFCEEGVEYLGIMERFNISRQMLDKILGRGHFKSPNGREHDSA